jgi:multisubunit Na+/H+ antiporter MnhC subunit
MLILNLIRAVFILFGIGLYHIYEKDFLSIDQGIVIFMISFLGLMFKEVLEDYVIRGFNPEDQTGSVYRGPLA